MRDGEDYVLNGSKMFITNAGEAAWFVVFASTDREAGHRGLSAFKQFGPLAQEAYQRLSALEHATPHARMDIADWQGTAVTSGQESA